MPRDDVDSVPRDDAEASICPAMMPKQLDNMLALRSRQSSFLAKGILLLLPVLLLVPQAQGPKHPQGDEDLLWDEDP